MGDLSYRIKVLRRVGMIKAENPARFASALKQLKKWGTSFPAGINMAAKRKPDQIAIIDDEGEITYRDLLRQANQFTEVLRERGIQVGDSVALLARNHRYFVIALIAVVQLGGRILLLNTMASRAQLTDLAEREGAELLIIDQEFLSLVEDVRRSRLVVAWVDDSANLDVSSITGLIAGKHVKDQAVPERTGEIVIFTSGTSGLPKGAKRREPEGIDPMVTYFGAVPYRANSVVIVGAPLFHSWGLLNFGFGLATVPTMILRRRFNAEQTLDDIDRYRANVLVAVPLMIQRMAALDESIVQKYDSSSLEVTASSGSSLPGDLATRFMDKYTDSIYNFYGATETSWVSIASPADLRAAPGTAGPVPWHTEVRVLDAEGKEVPTGEIGLIHVINEMPFGGYTDGKSRHVRDGLIETGDLGYFDAQGRLFVSGRDDDMIISGGENVFPSELEDCLIEHPDLDDVVVTGVADDEWGERLVAYVVPKPFSVVSEALLIDYAKDNVPRFAVPKAVLILDELPRNPAGKVMKRLLPPLDTVAR